MPNDIVTATGGLLGVEEAAKLMRGQKGKPPHPETVRGWIRRGYKPLGYKGDPVYLKAERWGRDLCTRMEWINEFEEARRRLAEYTPPALARPKRTRDADGRQDREYLRSIGAEDGPDGEPPRRRRPKRGKDAR